MKLKHKYQQGNLLDIMKEINGLNDFQYEFINERNFVPEKIEMLREFLLDEKPLHIISDSDADGLSSLAIVRMYLDYAGMYYTFDTLNRANRNPEEFLLGNHKNLLLDCGSGLSAETFGLFDILVFDHHEPQIDFTIFPVINPKVQGSYDNLCTSSLTYSYFSIYFNEEVIDKKAIQYSAIL